MRNALHSELEDFKVILDEAHISFFCIGHKANNAVREASFDAQNRAFSNIGSDGDAEGSRLPELALRKAGLAIGLRIIIQVIVGSLDVSRLKKWVWTAVKEVSISRAVT